VGCEFQKQKRVGKAGNEMAFPGKEGELKLLETSRFIFRGSYWGLLILLVYWDQVCLVESIDPRESGSEQK
jgi:hypothetical protein